METNDFARGSVWSIVPGSFEEVARTWIGFSEQTADERGALMLQMRGKATADRPYILGDDGVAIIEINGSLSKRATFFSRYFGGSSYEEIGKAIDAAVEDMDVKSILLKIDSPGGTLNGLDAVAEKVFEARGKKPVVAFSDGLMASAAYWIGAAADEVIAEKTAQVGSIGILLVHTDYSEYDKKAGINTTYLTAGKYKAVGNSSAPLDEVSRGVLQERLDFYYGLFIEAVSKYRDADEIEVVSNMADGRVFIGEQATVAGLIDRVETFDAVRAHASRLADSGNNFKTGVKAMEILTVAQLKESYPGLVDQIVGDAQALAEADHANQRAQGAAEENARIFGLMAAQFGEDKAEVLKKVAASGVSVEQFEAIREMSGGTADDSQQESAEEKTEREAREAAMAAINNTGAESPGSDANQGGGDDKSYMDLVDEYVGKHGGSKTEAMKIIARSHPEKRTAYIGQLPETTR